MPPLLPDFGPFYETALEYLEAGWSPLPLPLGAKYPPPEGFTGSHGRAPTRDEILRWRSPSEEQNIALRLPGDVIGIDIDHYSDKRGADQLRELEAEHGPLPATVCSTSRGDDDGPGVSRILLYRVPEGTRLRAQVAPAIEAVQRHHRYVVAWPSVHPDGRPYRWYDANDAPMDRVPQIDGLADLPWRWLEALRSVGGGDTAPAAAPEVVRAFIDAHTEARRPQALDGIRHRLEAWKPGQARHDTLVEMSCWTMREAAARICPAAAGIEMLGHWWREVIDDPARRDGTEFHDAIAWAVAQAEADPQRVAGIRDRDNVDELLAVAGVATAPPPANLPPEFWEARPTLAKIRDAAWSRTRSPDAVLGALLARVSAAAPPLLRLPAIVGTGATLDYCVAIVGPSGAGKSSAVAVARELLPFNPKDEIQELPIGSGEGLIEAYHDDEEEIDDKTGKARTVRRRVYRAALFTADEGEALASLGGRQGAVLLPVIRSAWAGSQLGQQNASRDRRRVIPGGEVRLSLVGLFQPDAAETLLSDAGGGTPQRFTWWTAVDPSIPDDPPPWPGTITIDPPQSGVIDVAQEVAREIRGRNLAVQRDELHLDHLDGHRDLVRLKTAALVAILCGGEAVTAEDWRLAGMILDASDRTRAQVAAHARRKRRDQSDARIDQRVREERALSDDKAARAVERMARAMGRHVHRRGCEGPCTKRCVSRAVASRDRADASIDEALGQALDRGWICRDGDTFTPGESRPV